MCTRLLSNIFHHTMHKRGGVNIFRHPVYKRGDKYIYHVVHYMVVKYIPSQECWLIYPIALYTRGLSNIFYHTVHQRCFKCIPWHCVQEGCAIYSITLWTRRGVKYIPSHCSLDDCHIYRIPSDSVQEDCQAYSSTLRTRWLSNIYHHIIHQMVVKYIPSHWRCAQEGCQIYSITLWPRWLWNIFNHTVEKRIAGHQW